MELYVEIIHIKFPTSRSLDYNLQVSERT